MKNHSRTIYPFSLPRPALMFAGACLLSLSTPAHAAGTRPVGDVNGDGKVDVADAVVAMQAGTRLRTLSPEAFAAADVNGDDRINVTDAVRILQHIGFGAPLGGTHPLVSARFSVDVATKKVTVTSLSPSASAKSKGGIGVKAVFTGATAIFNSSTLLDQPGDVGRKVLNVSFTNTSGEMMGQLPGGTVTGIRLFLSDFANLSAYPDIRSKSTVSTLAGTGAAGSVDGPVLSSTFNGPSTVTVDAQGVLYAVDYVGNTIRKISQGQVSTLAGSGAAASVNGAGTLASFNSPWGVAYSPTEDVLFVTEYGQNRIRRVTRQGNVTTAAGTGAAGGADGAGSVATFNQPIGITVGGDGAIYVAEAGNKIRKLVKSGSAYTVSTLAGNGTAGSADGIGAAARFNRPSAVAVDGNGVVYVADYSNQKIRRIEPSGAVSTIAGNGLQGTNDGTGDVARLNSPQGITLVNGALVVSDSSSHRLRQITLKPGGSPAQANSWVVQTLAGPSGAAETGSTDGPGELARFNAPRGIASDTGGAVYVADYGNRKVRKVIPANGYFPVGVPSAGSAEPVRLANPDGVLPTQNGLGNNGSVPYVLYPEALATGATSAAKKWTFIVPEGVTGFEFTVTIEASTVTLAPPNAVSNPGPTGVGSPDVRVSTVAGLNLGGHIDGLPKEAKFNSSNGIAVDANGNAYVADTNNHSVRRITPDGRVTTVAGVVGLGAGSANGNGAFAQFNGPRGVSATADGQTLYVTDSNNHTIRRIALTGPDPASPSSWTVSTIAGLVGSGVYAEGTGNVARFNFPVGIVVSPGGTVFVSEFSGNRVRRLQPVGPDLSLATSWRSSLVAGSSVSPVGTAGNTNGFGTSARFDLPAHIAIDGDSNLYVADVNNNRIRKISPDTDVSTLAGSTFGYVDALGTAAQFGQPNGVAVDTAGYVYVADTSFHRIRRISPSGITTTVAGTGDTFPGDLDGPGNVARFYFPLGIAVDASGSLYVISGGTYLFEGGGGVTSPGLRIRKIQRVLK